MDHSCEYIQEGDNNHAFFGLTKSPRWNMLTHKLPLRIWGPTCDSKRAPLGEGGVHSTVLLSHNILAN